MAKRSLQASQTGAKLARNAFDRKGWTQENLAAELELKTRQPIWRFFTCRPIERHIFVELCHILDLNWWEIAEHPPEFLLEMVRDPADLTALPPEPVGESAIEPLVKRVRVSCRDWIEHQCGTLRVLDTSSPANFDALYLPVDVIYPGSANSISCAARTPALKLLQVCDKLRILGKPGSGKTSLLKYIALQCIRGSFAADKVPIVIRLESFAAHAQAFGKWSLLDFISYEFAEQGIGDLQTVATLLTEGRFLLLLDALDEVLEPASYSAYKEISRFAERYYKNQFVITARLASDRFEFPQFTDAELADFTDEQVAALAIQWFKVFPAAEESPQSSELVSQLQCPENASIAALARLPLLFNAIAQRFQQRNDLAAQRLEIYEACLHILLERWDRVRGVDRSASCANLLSTIKQAVLVQLGATGFQQHRFQFERREIVQWAEENLEQLQPEPDSSRLGQMLGKRVLTALDNDHGLLVEQTQGTFSFTFAGFQHYFTAQWIVQGIAADPNAEGIAAVLAQRVADPDWREAVLLACAMTPASESIVGAVSQTLDRLTAEHPDLASFIDWTQQILLKSSIYQQLQTSFMGWQRLLRTPNLLADNAYLLLVLHTLAHQLLLEVLLDRLCKHALLLRPEDTARIETVTTVLKQAVALSQQAGYETEMRVLRSLQQSLPNLKQGGIGRHYWWQTNYSAWSQQVRLVLADWYGDDQYKYLTSAQAELLGQYAYLNRLLAECLNLRSRAHQPLSASRTRVVSFCPGCLKKNLPSSLSSVKKPPRIFTRIQAGRIEGIEVS